MKDDSQPDPRASEDPNRLYRVPDVAELWGVSVRNVWKRISRGELKVVKIGQSTRVSSAEIGRFISKGGSA